MGDYVVDNIRGPAGLGPSGMCKKKLFSIFSLMKII